ncbi:hypothetical protein BU23DRAFT_254473 [Bimuria novae-zelandiae CBS 107.79]|uniref:Uncharacterized protein n=1 Tax=Bimuria novae-zelandiae CBS 107.79 TaxID=1447943 RepID=A0A6A5VLY3_9PLEO|nr:hypothetical protein BU23DRAFT_254473 [Bimuria novae-zelandiae CBS 107.79]
MIVGILQTPTSFLNSTDFFWITLPMLLVVLSLYIYLDNHGAYVYHSWDIKIRVLTKPILVCTFLHQVFLPATTWLVKATLMFLILSTFKSIKWLQIMCCVGIVTTFVFDATRRQSDSRSTEVSSLTIRMRRTVGTASKVERRLLQIREEGIKTRKEPSRIMLAR